MKKKLFILIILLLTLSFNNVNAIEKANVYIFRGEGCSHCARAMTFFSTLKEKYGDFFELKDYEVWNNEENFALASKVANYFSMEMNAVPLIVIGNDKYDGYTESWNKDMEFSLFRLLTTTENRRVDVLKNIDNGITSLSQYKILQNEKTILKKVEKIEKEKILSNDIIAISISVVCGAVALALILLTKKDNF